MEVLIFNGQEKFVEVGESCGLWHSPSHLIKSLLRLDPPAAIFAGEIDDHRSEDQTDAHLQPVDV